MYNKFEMRGITTFNCNACDELANSRFGRASLTEEQERQLRAEMSACVAQAGGKLVCGKESCALPEVIVEVLPSRIAEEEDRLIAEIDEAMEELEFPYQR